MEWQELVATILAISLLVVLFFVGIEPIKKVYESFRGIGDTESSELTKIKNDCNAAYKEGCALEVAKGLVESGGSLFEAKSWLDTEIKNVERTNKQVLEESFVLAQRILDKSQDFSGAKETFELLQQKGMTSDALRIAIANVQVAIDILPVQDALLKAQSNPSSITSLSNEQLAELFSSLKESLTTYTNNKNEISDRAILSSCGTVSNTVSDDGRICSLLARESLSTACFVDNGACTSCKKYSLESLDSRIDVCSGYKNAISCKADSCNKGDCVWIPVVGGQGGTCVSGFTAFGQSNDLDVSP